MRSFLFPLLIILASCDFKPAEEDKGSESSPPLDPEVFAPKIGETMIFHQTSKVLSSEAESPIEKSDLTETKSKRIQIYEGPLDIDGLTFYRFSVTLDGEQQPDLLLSYTQETLFIAAQSQPDGSFDIKSPPVPIAQKGMRVGTFWRWPPGAVGSSGFRTVSYEEVRVPAGVFDAYKVTFQGDQVDSISLKDYWFAPGVGIIREESRRYSGGFLRNQSVVELEQVKTPGEFTSSSNP